MSLTRRTLLCLCGLAARPHPAPPTCCRAVCHRPLISPVPRTGLAAFGSRNLGCPPDYQDHAWGRGAQAVAWRSQVCMGTCY